MKAVLIVAAIFMAIAGVIVWKVPPAVIKILFVLAFGVVGGLVANNNKKEADRFK